MWTLVKCLSVNQSTRHYGDQRKYVFKNLFVLGYNRLHFSNLKCSVPATCDYTRCDGRKGYHILGQVVSQRAKRMWLKSRENFAKCCNL